MPRYASCTCSKLFFLLKLIWLLTLGLSLRGADGVTEIDLRLRGLVYDPFTEKLYGTSAVTNNLLQIEPLTGAVIRSFDVGTTPSHLKLSAGNGIWVGLDGEGAVRRFNLETLAADEKIIVNAGTTIRDMAPSAADPYTLAVTTSDRTWMIRNGLVLPQASALGYVSMSENFAYGQLSPGSVVAKTEIIPNGFGGLVQGAGVVGFFGDSEAFPDALFHSSGRIYWTVNMALVGTMSPLMSPAAMADVTWNKETDELFYLEKGPAWVLYRFDRSTRVQTGYGALGPAEADPAYFNLQAWSTNRAAFHTREKLYVVDLDEVFLPADVAVSQFADPASISFGTNLTVRVTVTNKGPGAALNVVLTNYMETIHGRPANIRLPLEQFEVVDPASIEPIRTVFGLIPAGDARTFSIKYFPGSPGTFTNRAVVTAANEAAPQDNSNLFTVAITPQSTNGITRVPIPVFDLVSVRQTGELWVYGRHRLWKIDPAVPRVTPLPGLYLDGTRVATSSSGDVLYVGFFHDGGHSRYLARVPAGPLIFGDGAIFDMEVSPTDPELVAISQNSGTLLHRGGERLALGIAQAGYMAFSPDGARLYLASQQNCDLGIYTVTQNGLTLERTLPNVSCAEFTLGEGLLFFDNGLVFDPATGARVPNTPVVTPPAFLIAERGGFDMFNRTNGTWIVRRFRSSNGTNFVQYAERQYPEITSQVIEVGDAGRDRIALRTGDEIILVDLPGDPDFMEAGISQERGDAEIRFASTAGARYRIETTQQLQPAAWTTVEENITGDGSSVAVTVPMQNETGFYRVVRLP